MRRALLGVLLATPAFAQAPLRLAPSEEQRRLAVALMDAVGVQALLDELMTAVQTRMTRLFRNRGMTEAMATRAVDGLIMPEFRDRRADVAAAMSAAFYRRYSEAELRDLLRLMTLPIMDRQREATLGTRWLTPFEWIQLKRLQWREPVLQRLADETAAIRKEMVELANETLGRIGEAAVRKHINTLRYNGFRT